MVLKDNVKSKCSICFNISELAKSNVSQKTGLRLYRSWCISCEKVRKDTWRSNNKDTHNLNSKNWNAKNSYKRKEIAKEYRDSNKDLCRTLSANWKKLNKNKVNLNTNLRRKRIKQATPKLATELEKLFFVEIYHLAQLRNLEVDHIIPLEHPLVCGLHVPENLQLLTKHDNCVKSNHWQQE